MELKFSKEMLANLQHIVMYIDGACHAVATDHPSVSATFNNVARNLDKVVQDVQILNGLIDIVLPDDQQPQPPK
jgi:hypothetical protein